MSSQRPLRSSCCRGLVLPRPGGELEAHHGFLIIDQRPVDRVERLDEVDAPATATSSLATAARSMSPAASSSGARRTPQQRAGLSLPGHAPRHRGRHVVGDREGPGREPGLCSPDNAKGRILRQWRQVPTGPATRSSTRCCCMCCGDGSPTPVNGATAAPALMTQVRRIAVPLVPNRRDTHSHACRIRSTCCHQASSDTDHGGVPSRAKWASGR